MREFTVSVPNDVGGAIDWLSGHLMVSPEKVLVGVLSTGLCRMSRALGDDDFELLVDAAALAVKRWMRSEAPTMWNWGDAKRRPD